MEGDELRAEEVGVAGACTVERGMILGSWGRFRFGFRFRFDMLLGAARQQYPSYACVR